MKGSVWLLPILSIIIISPKLFIPFVDTIHLENMVINEEQRIHGRFLQKTGTEDVRAIWPQQLSPL